MALADDKTCLISSLTSQKSDFSLQKLTVASIKLVHSSPLLLLQSNYFPSSHRFSEVTFSHFFLKDCPLCSCLPLRPFSVSLSAPYRTGSKRQEIQACVCPALPLCPFLCACVCFLLHSTCFGAAVPLCFALFLQAITDSRLESHSQCLTSPPGLGSNTKRI